MARSISDEEIQLRKRARRRLVGAIVLVLLVVVFLPMVLDKTPKPVVQAIAIRIPARDINDFAPLSAPDGGATAPGTSLRAAPQAGGAASAAPTSKPVVAAATKEAPKKAPKKVLKKVPGKPEAQQPRTEPAKASNGEAAHKVTMFVVQMGAFSRPDNAKRMLAKLSAHQVKCYSEVVKTASGKKTRVRAGPYRTKEEAEKAKARLHAIGISGGEVVPQMLEDKGGKG